MSDERNWWVVHCYRMAGATYALADNCEDVAMLEDYIRLGARWIALASRPPPLDEGKGNAARPTDTPPPASIN